jgi:hypothetical protein
MRLGHELAAGRADREAHDFLGLAPVPRLDRPDGHDLLGGGIPDEVQHLHLLRVGDLRGRHAGGALLHE